MAKETDDLERQVAEALQERCRHAGKLVGTCHVCRPKAIAAALRAAISTAEALASPMDVERAITISFLTELKGGDDG